MQIAASLAKDVYVDGLQPPIKVLGETLAGILRAITHYPRLWGQVSEISLDEKTERFRKNLVEKVEAIPEENRILPPPNILGPSVQALEYGIFDDHLSDMFSALIANSMDSRLSNKLHPAFINVIPQLSPEEGRFLDSFRQIKINLRTGNVILPYIISNSSCANGHITEDAKFINSRLNDRDLYLSGSGIENLLRLGLIYLKSTQINVPLQYEKIEEYIESLNSGSDCSICNTNFTTIYTYGHWGLSPFGRDFVLACIFGGV